jgi:hypothetical protein
MLAYTHHRISSDASAVPSHLAPSTCMRDGSSITKRIISTWSIRAVVSDEIRAVRA